MESVCVHYWLVDDKDIGRCKKCGLIKDFGKLLKERKPKPKKKEQVALPV